jgi:hypothetical protein
MNESIFYVYISSGKGETPATGQETSCNISDTLTEGFDYSGEFTKSHNLHMQTVAR